MKLWDVHAAITNTCEQWMEVWCGEVRLRDLSAESYEHPYIMLLYGPYGMFGIK